MKEPTDGTDAHSGPTSDAFEKLLVALDADRQKAGEAYEKIRQKLVRFFEWRGAASTEDLADETMDRVTRKLEAGETIRSADPAVYFYGVARNVLREHWAQTSREREAVRDFPRPAQGREPDRSPAEESAAVEQRLQCLERCLDRLPTEGRELILSYYQESRHIEARKALAQGLGIPLNALRIRAFRLRAQLESCVAECVRHPRPEMNSRFSHQKGGRTMRP